MYNLSGGGVQFIAVRGCVQLKRSKCSFWHGICAQLPVPSQTGAPGDLSGLTLITIGDLLKNINDYSGSPYFT